MTKPIKTILLLLMLSAPLASCAQDKVKEYTYKVEEVFPHDRGGYTQGLFFYEGVLYESTGQYGESTFRKVDLKTGNLLAVHNFPKKYFVEGSCILGGMLYILTWQENVCFMYEAASMTKIAEFYNPREGWGLTTDGQNLIMSDGTSTLYYMNPNSFTEIKRINVTLNKKPLSYLNELEYIDGKIWANVYGSEEIVIIDPGTGAVTGKINCAKLLSPNLISRDTDVLNGIAYNPETGFIYLTGKNWPRIFRVSLREL